MHVGRKSTGSQKLIDMGADPFEKSSIAPQLRRSFCQYSAPQALGLLAGAPIKLPEHMSGANEPMLMRRVQLDGLFSIRFKSQRLCADQRHVVKMDNVVGLSVKDFENFAPLQTGASSLLGKKRR